MFEPFSGDFSHFPAIFPPLPPEAKIHSSTILPDLQSVAGQRDRSGEDNALGKYRALPQKIDPYRDESGLGIFEN